ncbi:ImmA/IrrE family metallo-endopeptidase, partial [Methylobacterium sp. J-072]
MDLVDAASPEALVKRILQAEPNLSVPVPIQDLCARLGILGIEDLDTDEFEGGLVTDAKRSEGTILVKRGGEPRRRFTIAHELAHFLLAHHVPDQSGRRTISWVAAPCSSTPAAIEVATPLISRIRPVMPPIAVTAWLVEAWTW